MERVMGTSRRALFAGGLAGIGAWAAGAIGRAAPSLAANGDIVQVGGAYSSTAPTSVYNHANGDQAGAALAGISDHSAGVIGNSNSTTAPAISGISYGFNGVQGESMVASASGVYGQNTEHGYGIAGRSNAHGLGVNDVFAAAALGENTADGVGVWARSQSGVGLYADAIDLNAAVALKTRGVTQFSRSGKLTITAGHASATKTGIRVDSGSLVLATLQQDRSGIYVRSAVPNATGDSFTIRLNKAVSNDTRVGWFIVN